MNILIVGKFGDDDFGFHINYTLKKMGHKTFLFNQTFRLFDGGRLLMPLNQVYQFFYANWNEIPKIKMKKTKKLLTELDTKIDLTIVTHDFFYPEQVDFIKKHTKSPVVLWFPDSILGLRKGLCLNSEYDFYFFKDPYIVRALKNELNLNTFYLPECCNPDFHKKIEINEVDLGKYVCDLLVVGNIYSNRVAFLNQLTVYNLKLYGSAPPFWMNVDKIKKFIQYEYLRNIEKAKAFRVAKIVLNNLHPAEIESMNARTFEVAACGGFQIASYKKSLDLLFNKDEIVTYLDINDLKKKIDYYLIHDNERIVFAENAYKRVHTEHTYEIRLHFLLDKIINASNDEYKMINL